MQNKAHESTMNYYNNNANTFIDRTFSTNIYETQDKFLSQINHNSHILDVGCGSGRDTLYFLNKGHNVTAFDASEELAKIVSQKINHPIDVKNILDMDWEQQFDAVWAMASLLHLKKEDLPLALELCAKSLKNDGQRLFFASFKLGQGESFDDNGRFFSYYSEDELKTILNQSNLFDKITYTIDKDKLGREDLNWISFTGEVKPQLTSTKKIKLK